VADIVEAMAEVAPVERLRVDGGLTNDETLLQIQADALGLPLIGAGVGRADTTVLGAAMLAGVGAGVFASVEDAARAAAAITGRVVGQNVCKTDWYQRVRECSHECIEAIAFTHAANTEYSNPVDDGDEQYAKR
jgi:glycerol kinase